MGGNDCLTSLTPLCYFFKILVIFLESVSFDSHVIRQKVIVRARKFVANESSTKKSQWLNAQNWAFNHCDFLALSLATNFGCSDGLKFSSLQKFYWLTCKWSILEQYAPKTTAGRCTGQHTIVWMLQNFKGFYNQKNRCSSARLEFLEPTTPGSGRKIPQRQANLGVHREFKWLWSHLGLIPTLLRRTGVTGRPGKLTHGLAPERGYRWFDLPSDQIRVMSMNIKFSRKLGKKS